MLLISFIFGICFGSFANTLVYRLPQGMSILKPPSCCPECNKQIKTYDLIPVFSFLFLKRKCRYCASKISLMYPATEIICGLLFAVTAFVFPFPVVVPFAVFTFALIVVTFVDIKIQEIPDSMLVLIVFAAALYIILDPGRVSWQQAAIGAISGALPLFVFDKLTLLIAKKNGFGFGDMKLMGAAGLLLGWQGILTAFYIAFTMGMVAAFIMLIAKKADRGKYIAFAPFLCAGILISVWVYALYGVHLLNLLFLFS